MSNSGDDADESPPSPQPSPPPTSSSSAAPAPAPSSDSVSRAQSSIQSLSLIVPSLPSASSLSSSPNPALSLLTDPSAASAISRLLHLPSSGAGGDNLCRWLYDTFQSSDPSLQLVVLRFLPTVAGLYLSRSTSRHLHHHPLAGFEAVLLALYAHETLARNSKPLTVDFPNLTFPSPYHEAFTAPAAAVKAPPLKISTTPTKQDNKNNADESVRQSNVSATVTISEALIPHGTVRSTKRARIVSVALELYYSKISDMPVESKIEFCKFAEAWAGNYNNSEAKEEEVKEGGDANAEEKGKRVAIPMELLQPVLRIVGHCLLGQPGRCVSGDKGEELRVAAEAAAKGLHKRAMHDMDAGMVLATRSLVKVGLMDSETMFNPPEMPSVYSSASAAAAAETAAS